MMFHAIDSIHVATAGLDACRGYERLSPARHGRRTLHVGGPSQLFAVHVSA